MCGKPGHFVDKCYHRFDRNFQRPSGQGFGQFGRGGGGFQNQIEPHAFLINLSESNEVFMADLGSTSSHNSPTSYPASVSLYQYNSQASYQSSASNSPWFVDSSATNHIITSLNNLSLPSHFQGTEKVTIGDGDGKSLPISYIGVGYLHTQSNSWLVLSLPHILHVPHIKSLLSVS